MIQKIHYIPFLIGFFSSQIFAEEAEWADEELWDENIPVVLSATRLKQAQSEAPASITVIDKSMLVALGVRKLPEIFRLVPGMQVGYASGNQAAVGYHGLTDDNSRRLQVLVDGRSIYQSAFSRILWFDLPLAIENIARIEVIRGPNTAAYGANSYLAIINIITHHPGESTGAKLVFRNGDRGVNDLSASWSDVSGDFEYKFTASSIDDNGFDLARDKLSPRHDSQDSNFIQFDGIYNNQSEQYRIQTGYKIGKKQVKSDFSVSPFHTLDDDHSFIEISYENTISDDRKRKLQLYYDSNKISENWDVCIPRLFVTNELFDLYSLDKAYTEQLVDALFSGGTTPTPATIEIANQTERVLTRAFNDGAIETCGVANQDVDETRFDLEWEETLRLNKTTRMVAGFNLRRDKAKSETFFDGSLSKNTSRIFSHIEWKVTEDTLINLGANFENDSDAGSEFSPRLAVVHHLSQTHTLRAIVATATRTPDLFEESANWKYRIASPTPRLPSENAKNFFYQHSQAAGELTAEKIRSYELGYFGHFAEAGILLDIKYFNDELSSVIEGETKLVNFQLSNTNSMTFSGIEVQLDYRISNSIRWWNSYAYVNINDTNKEINIKTVIKHSGSSVLFYNPNNNWDLSAALYANSSWFGQKFIRADISSSYTLKISDNWQLNSRVSFQHRFDDNYLFDSSNNFSNSNTFYLQFTLSQN